MRNYDIYIILIVLVKIGFIGLAVTHLYFKRDGKINSEKDKEVLFWKERFEFVFIILMACLLIYLFNPRNERSFMINYETKLLLFLFGFILLITANWNTFIEESEIFKDIKSSV
jgi:Na+/H+ antiporter NhaD/arsenite permease-like protein